ncbi:hypothetical protein [Orbus mooreae]|uniref:hypothetical protein n=1 Tax=Orbus mooreae TaxID=3074107 RepID=UPI00370D5187
MKILKMSGLVAAIALLSACAQTPAEKAAEAKEHAQQLLETQITLANECDPQAATLMQQLPTANSLPAAQKIMFEKEYYAKINNPTFQACYNLAWKSYKEENQLKIARMQEWNEAQELDWDNGMFFNGPFGYW